MGDTSSENVPMIQSSKSDSNLPRSVALPSPRRLASLTHFPSMPDERAPWRLRRSRSSLSIEDTMKKVSRGVRIALIGGDSRSDRVAACEEAAALCQGFCVEMYRPILSCLEACKNICELEGALPHEKSDAYLSDRIGRWLCSYNPDFLVQSLRRRLNAHTPKDAIFVPDAESEEQLDFLAKCGFTIVTLSKSTGKLRYHGPLASFDSREDFFSCLKGLSEKQSQPHQTAIVV